MRRRLSFSCAPSAVVFLRQHRWKSSGGTVKGEQPEAFAIGANRSGTAHRGGKSRPPRRQMSATASELARSVDLAKEVDRLDVEKYFPVAMSHLRTTSLATSFAGDERKARDWKEIVSTTGVDGNPLSKTDQEKNGPFSHFDDGSIDIRGASSRKGQQQYSSVSREESLSPDVLQLTGGRSKQHGGALTNQSNLSPADATIEMEENDLEKSAYGDTPVQLTAMLKERLMELKAEKLREDRNDTYMPRRLKLLSDVEVQGSLRRENLVKNMPEKSNPSPKAVKVTTTLADLIDDNENHFPSDQHGENMVVAVKARDTTAAKSVLRKAVDWIPGASAYDPLTSSSSKDAGGAGNSSFAVPDGKVHLLRCLPRAGFCSRREALAIISSGQVRVDNVVERNPFRLVQAENSIHVSGHTNRLRFAPPRLWMYHKPSHVVVSRNDVDGRTLFTKHARILGMDHLVPVGSLPMRAHGLLLLTNDGELSRFLENPASMIQHTYLLRVRPAIDPVLAHKFNTEGIVINGKKFTNIEFLVNPAMKSRYSVKVKVRGETMPIAHLMQHLGRVVERGGRISFGPFSMRGLAVGSIREVTVPPRYTLHTGAMWKEFVERDWPYFRRQRVTRLRQLARYRELTPKESEELDNFTYEELKDCLTFQSQELASLSEKQAQVLSTRPVLNEHPLANDFGDVDGNIDVLSENAELVKDITAVR